MIYFLDVFSELNKELIILLENLSKEDWEKDTCLKNRNVKDLASHIIDTSLRRLAIQRDNYFSENPKINSYEDLVDFIQKINRDWIVATKRLSPEIIISLLKNSENELVEFLKTLNPYEKAPFPVNWAGENESENWFDIAREYTEKWHHQMQILDAVGIEGNLYNKPFFQPVIDTFIKAIPFAYDKLDKTNFTITVEIKGSCGGTFNLQKIKKSTTFIDNIYSKNKVSINQEEFWKLVTNSKPKSEIKLECVGDKDITDQFLAVVAVMS